MIKKNYLVSAVFDVEEFIIRTYHVVASNESEATFIFKEFYDDDMYRIKYIDVFPMHALRTVLPGDIKFM